MTDKTPTLRVREAPEHEMGQYIDVTAQRSAEVVWVEVGGRRPTILALTSEQAWALAVVLTRAADHLDYRSETAA